MKSISEIEACLMHRAVLDIVKEKVSGMLRSGPFNLVCSFGSAEVSAGSAPQVVRFSYSVSALQNSRPMPGMALNGVYEKLCLPFTVNLAGVMDSRGGITVENASIVHGEGEHALDLDLFNAHPADESSAPHKAIMQWKSQDGIENVYLGLILQRLPLFLLEEKALKFIPFAIRIDRASKRWPAFGPFLLISGRGRFRNDADWKEVRMSGSFCIRATDSSRMLESHDFSIDEMT